MFVAGIDVGGSAKGFHIAVADLQSLEVVRLVCQKSVPDAVEFVASFDEMLVVAIDAPVRCRKRSGEKAGRACERFLHRRGFRLQWTPTPQAASVPEWMERGEALFRAIEARRPDIVLLETFPTAANENLAQSRLKLPLAVFPPRKPRNRSQDYVDACLCADVAERYLRCAADWTGDEDGEGAIYW